MVIPDGFIEDTYESNKSDSLSAAIATCKTLNHLLSTDSSLTLQEFSLKIKDAIERIKKIEPLIEVESLSEIFLRFISLTVAEYQSIDEARKALISRGQLFQEKVINCKHRIAKYGHPFIYEGSTILIHSFSQVVLEILIQAKSAKRQFSVYVTQSNPDDSGEVMQESLKEHGIECNLILDAAVGFFMEKVDMVLVGADGIVENGGIINKIGTFPIALCAKAFNKPFYVAAESYKFIRQYPLYQSDIPQPKTVQTDHYLEFSPLVDYTPPSLITLLHTDLGTLTTAAVSDMLIHLYV